MISNLADSGGFQDTAAENGEFGGFGMTSSTEAIHQMPGYDLNGILTMGPYQLLAEFLSSVRPFGVTDLSFNDSGAFPKAINVEASYDFQCFNKPTLLALGYGWTNESLALQMPQQRISAIMSISWWRDTLESLEFRHDLNYGATDYASGIGSAVPTYGAGGSADTLTASLAVYF